MGSEGPVWTAVHTEFRVSSACGWCSDSCVLEPVLFHLMSASGGQFCSQPQKGDLSIHIVSLFLSGILPLSSSIIKFGKGSRYVLQPGLRCLSPGHPPCHPAEELAMEGGMNFHTRLNPFKLITFSLLTEMKCRDSIITHKESLCFCVEETGACFLQVSCTVAFDVSF